MRACATMRCLARCWGSSRRTAAQQLRGARGQEHAEPAGVARAGEEQPLSQNPSEAERSSWLWVDLFLGRIVQPKQIILIWTPPMIRCTGHQESLLSRLPTTGYCYLAAVHLLRVSTCCRAKLKAAATHRWVCRVRAEEVERDRCADRRRWSGVKIILRRGLWVCREEHDELV